MPALILLKSPIGGTPGESIPLAGDNFVIGRDAEVCQIVIPHHAVSRKHAQIVKQQGVFYLEDLKSRNKTFLNNKELNGRSPLQTEDRIKICDFLFRFQDDRSSMKQDLPDWMKKESTEANAPGAEMTTFEASLSRGHAQNLLENQPAERIRALLEISTSLSRTLDLDTLLNQIAATLFGAFKQADRCFIILVDEAGRAVPKVVKSRRAGMDDTRFSKTIVRKTVESMESFLSEDASVDASLGPAQSIAEFKIRSVMCVPLAGSDSRPLGAIQLDTQERSKKFKEDDLKLLTIVANLAAVAIEKARLHLSDLAREREHQEIELAKKVQLGFLPQTVPTISGYEFFSHYSPAKTVGGDYYDFIALPDGRLAITVADVAGKGVAAALLTAKLSSEVRFCILTQPHLADAIACLNEALLRGGLDDRFVTMAMLILDPKAHTLTIANAGHMTPLLYHGGWNEARDIVSNEMTGVPLGVIPGYEFEVRTVTIDMGDIVTIYTDGVTDAMNHAGDLFGNEGLQRIFAGDDSVLHDLPRPSKLGERLITAVRKFAGGRSQNDDIAVVCFGRIDLANGPPTNARMTDAGPSKMS